MVDFWADIKNNLKAKNSNNKLLQTWFEPTDLVGFDDVGDNRVFRLGVPTDLHKYWISENLFDRICSEISAVYRKPFQVELIVTGKNPANDQSEPSTDDLLKTRPSQLSIQKRGVSSHKSTQMNNQMNTQGSHDYPKRAVSTQLSSQNGYSKPLRKDSLNPEYTFSTFVVGRNNEFAHAASFNISENPGANGYNPLFICGPTGMGKTHLLNAVGNHIRSHLPHFRVFYVSAERFLNECIAGIRRNEMEKFRTRYREQCEVLLIDDIQILGRGEAVQDEFFHTLNDFFEKGQQVIVAADRMPKDIQGLEDRIRTRLEWGLIADIQMPDLETRVAILKYKAERKSLRVPDEVINYIGRISKRSIRELEGNLNKLKMYTELQGLEMTIEIARKVLATHAEPASLTMEDIQKLVTQHFNVRMSDLKSKSRAKPIVVARQLAMYLIKKHLDKSLVEIGRAFGGKDHTTVINAIRKIDNQLASNSELKRDLNDLENRIHNITGL